MNRDGDSIMLLIRSEGQGEAGGDEKKHSSVRVEVVGHGSSLQILGYQVLNDSNSWGTAFLVGDTPIPINSYNGVEQNNSEFSSRNSHFLSRGQRK